MRKLILCASVVAAFALPLTATASADPSLVQISATCTTGTNMFPATLTLNTRAAPFEPRLFVTNRATGEFLGVLIVTSSTTASGEPVTFPNPGVPVSALSGALTTCTFTTFETFITTGILAPTVP